MQVSASAVAATRSHTGVILSFHALCQLILIKIEQSVLQQIDVIQEWAGAKSCFSSGL